MSAPARIRTDSVVVGSGAGGAAVAGELLRAGQRVVLVEAGPQLGPRPGAHLRNARPSEDELDAFGAQIEATLGFHGGAEAFPDSPGTRVVHAVGGALVHWTHHCPEPDPAERPRAVPEAAWDGLLMRARELLHADATLRSGGVRHERLLRLVAAIARDAGPRPVQPLPVAAVRVAGGLRYSGGDDLLFGGGAPADRLTILPMHVARRIEVSGGRATGVLAAGRSDSAETRIEADAVVAAAGAIGTPQLLHASGIRPPALGRYAMDHPMLASRVALRADVVTGAPTDDPEFSIWIPLGPGRPFHAQIVRCPIAPSVLPGETPQRETADLFHFCGMDPDAENGLTFDGDRHDAFGLPCVALRMRLSAADRGRIGAAAADQFELAAAIGRVHEGWQPQLFPLGSAVHIMGTHRLGRDEASSVADSDGRVWGLENLHVAGNGVLSEYNACNPTLTTVALALRTADAIVAGARTRTAQTTHEPGVPA